LLIGPGYVDTGDTGGVPFDRLEVWEGHTGANDETKVVNWSGNTMTINWRGQTCQYDFGNWVKSGACGSSSSPPPPPPPPPPSCTTGDLNCDGIVDVIDLGIALAGWGGSGPCDLNGDNVCDIIDLGILLANWG